MARALLVGCGCHGRELGRVLLGGGWTAAMTAAVTGVISG